MKIEVKDLTGKKHGLVSLPREIFEMDKKIKPEVWAQAVGVYLSNRRQATRSAKRRGEVEGSGRKIWRQKGTGNARHGDRQAPIFVGGGVAHGPKGNENYARQLPGKMRNLVLKAALTLRVKEKSLVVVKSLGLVKPKTAEMAKVLHKVASYKLRKRLTLVLTKDEWGKSRRWLNNLKGVNLESAKSLNVLGVMRGGDLVMTESALKELGERFKV